MKCTPPFTPHAGDNEIWATATRFRVQSPHTVLVYVEGSYSTRAPCVKIEGDFVPGY